MNVTPKWILPGQDPTDAYFVRETVFVDEQGFSLEIELDEIDPIAHHVVFYNEAGSPVAVGRTFADEEAPGTWIIGRVAVMKEMRGTGLGRVLMQEMERHAKAQGAVRTVLGAQLQASGFYGALGYTPFGEHYFEEFCEHVHMEKLY